jgi:hypothetical protein
MTLTGVSNFHIVVSLLDTLTYHSTLIWRRFYIFPVIIFPFGASAVQIAMVLKYDATKPSNDFHCDASHPQWCA